MEEKEMFEQIRAKLDALKVIVDQIEELRGENERQDAIIQEATAIREQNNQKIAELTQQLPQELTQQLPQEFTQQYKSVFGDLSLSEKKEAQTSLLDNIKLGLKVMKSKAREMVDKAVDSAKDKVQGLKNTYNSLIEFKDQQIEELNNKIAEHKAAKEEAERKAIEQFKTLGIYNEQIADIDNKIERTEQSIEHKERLIEKKEEKIKVEKAIAKIEKKQKGFIFRFIENLSLVGDSYKLDEEKKDELRKMKGVEEVKKVGKSTGIISRVKQAFSMTREQGKELREEKENRENQVMDSLNESIDYNNDQIAVCEARLGELQVQRGAAEKEMKEKVVEAVKEGNLKVSDVKKYAVEQYELCSNPVLIVAQARASKLYDKLARFFGKKKEKEASRNSGMDR